MTTTNTYNQSSLDDDDLLSSTISISPTSIPLWGGAATAGSVLTTGTNGLYWGDVGSSIISNTSNTISIGDRTKSLTIKGEAEFESDITIKGVKLMDTLQKIEQRLNILRVDPQLESRWAELQELGERYRALEAECIDKELIIDILKR
jgi:hypothetical protein